MSALTLHRLHFAFTVTFHYLFPQLTMGLALLIFVLKTLGLRTGKPEYDTAARFWARIFAINFAVGVVTGVPMEFQFGTNWSRFSEITGAVIGQPLGMEGVFAFFLESTFLGLFLFGERRFGRRLHWFSAAMVFLGSWISGFFIIATDAWMQHPVGDRILKNGTITLNSLTTFLTNPWLPWQYLHNMLGAVVTGSLVVAAVGALYLLTHRHIEQSKLYVKTGVIAGCVAAILILFPTGDRAGANVTRFQPVTLAAMEGLFHSERGAQLVILGQPDPGRMSLDNPLTVPKALSFLTYRRWQAEVKGLDAFPKALWPDNIPLLYYSYHIMVGLGTIFIAALLLAALALWRRRLYDNRALLWMLLLLFPFPYIANTAGWMTAELGRQPWLVYGILPTTQGYSANVSAGNALFTLIGFMGLYLLLGLLFLLLIYRELERGPDQFSRLNRTGAP